MDDAYNGPCVDLLDGSPIDGFYTGMTIIYNGGWRFITDYDGSTKTATLSAPFFEDEEGS